MKVLFLILTLSTLPTAFSYGEFGLGSPSATMESLYEKLEQEEQSRNSGIVRLQTSLDYNYDGISRPTGGDSLDGNYVLDVNLVFEDGEEVKGSVALSWSAYEAEEKFIRGSVRIVSLSAERVEGVLENIMKIHEEEYGKNIVRVDVISGEYRFTERGDPVGIVFGGNIGLQRLKLKVGLAAMGGDNLSFEVTADATRERGGIFSDKNDRPNYSLFGIEGKLTYYFSKRWQAQGYVRSEKINDFDSSYEETVLSAGGRIRYFITK